MDQAFVNYLHTQYESGSWLHPSARRQKRLVWRFFLSPALLRGWELVRPPEQLLLEQARVTQSFWRPEKGRQNAVVEFRVFECLSASDASRSLLDRLGEFQLPLRRDGGDEPIGDVAFSTEKDHTLLFVRANLVCLIRNADRDLIAVRDLGKEVDKEIQSTRGRESDSPPELTSFNATPVADQPAVKFILHCQATDPMGSRLWYKFFAKQGTLSQENGHVVYVPSRSGQQHLTAIAINERLACARSELTFTRP
jgi:hypothetical protein